MTICSLACEKVAGDLGLASGFYRYSCILQHLQLASHELVKMWKKVTTIEIPFSKSLCIIIRSEKYFTIVLAILISSSESIPYLQF